MERIGEFERLGEKERERVFANMNTKVRVVWDQAVRFCLLPLRVSVAGMSCVSGIVGSRGFAPHSRL